MHPFKVIYLLLRVLFLSPQITSQEGCVEVAVVLTCSRQEMYAERAANDHIGGSFQFTPLNRSLHVGAAYGFWSACTATPHLPCAHDDLSLAYGAATYSLC